MKISSLIASSTLFLGLILGIPNKSFSPDIKSYMGHTLSEIKEINHKERKEKRKQFIVGELEKPISKFNIPVDTGQVSCVYGNRKVKGRKEFHKGMDIGVVGNASLKFVERPDILAVAPGIVTFSGWEKGYGKVVKIKHSGDLETIYGHLHSFSVSKKDTVLPGQKIGEMGKSGNARSNKKWGTGLHLHFEARKDGKYFNPNEFFTDYKKIGIDDTLYASINYLIVEDFKLPEKNNLENVVASVDSSEKILRKIAKYLPLFNFFGSNSKKDTLESFYGVQIAASIDPLPEDKIKEFEDKYGMPVREGKMAVNKNGKEIMYNKYTIGNYKTFEEAKRAISYPGFEFEGNPGIAFYEKGKLVKTEWNY